MTWNSSPTLPVRSRENGSPLGIRGMYGYCLDLSTEPRWFRITETFAQDADLVSEIATP